MTHEEFARRGACRHLVRHGGTLRPAIRPEVQKRLAPKRHRRIPPQQTAGRCGLPAGQFHPAAIGFDGVVQEDGSIVFYTEIDLEEPIPRQEEYTISMYLASRRVTPEGEHLMDTRISEDWFFTIAPTKLETR